MMSAMVYKWKGGSPFKTPAQKVGEELERLRSSKNGNLIAADVVRSAKSKNSVLHQDFEWDDAKAAHFHRLETARQMLKDIVVVTTNRGGEPTTVRAFVNVGQSEERGFTSMHVAMADPDLRAQILDRAWKELQDWRRRYDDLVEFAEFFKIIDDKKAA